MERTIWKYAVPITDRFTLTLPVGAQILSVQMQGDQPQLWALVDPAAELEPRQFRLAGTGHSISERHLHFLGTFQTLNVLVFHLFEAKAA